MTEPTTPGMGLIVPNTGDLSGSWGTAALNPNFNAIDGMFVGQLSLSVAGATTITLTTASATLTPTAGPYQSANSIYTIGGNPTGTSFIQLTQPGIYRFLNTVTANAFPTVIKPAIGTGSQVALPPGEFWQVGFNGTSCAFIGMPHVGSYMDMSISTYAPWMLACTTVPWLICDGNTTRVVSIYPALAALLGSTYGGNGITNFGVPDFSNRVMIPLDVSGSGRVTSGGSGINGAQLGAAGGNQLMQSHNHASPAVNDPGHLHSMLGGGPAGPGPLIEPGSSSFPLDLNTQSAVTNITLSANVGTTGSGSSQNIPPGLVGGVRFIKT